MKKKSESSSKLTILIFLVTFIGIFIFLQKRADNAAKQYSLFKTSPVPALSPVPYIEESSPSPDKEAITLDLASMILSPAAQWQSLGTISDSEMEKIRSTMFSDEHLSYEKWQAIANQESGEADRNKYFDSTIYSYYKNELEKLNWVSQDIADGVTGAVRRFHGVKESKARDIILEYSLNNQNDTCSSAGCLCPCAFTYTLYLSSIDPIVD